MAEDGLQPRAVRRDQALGYAQDITLSGDVSTRPGPHNLSKPKGFYPVLRAGSIGSVRPISAT
jgi:hypothetical protein